MGVDLGDLRPLTAGDVLIYEGTDTFSAVGVPSLIDEEACWVGMDALDAVCVHLP